MKHRVVVTGTGVISPLGQNTPVFWQNLLAGQNGIGAIQAFDASLYDTQIAAEVHDFDILPLIEKKNARRMARFTQFVIAATAEALQQSALVISPENCQRVGVNVGCGIGGLQIVEEQHNLLREKGPNRVSPLFIPMFIPNMAAGQVAIFTGAKGPNSCVVTACASATHAIGEAFRLLQRGDADAMLTGGTESAITPLSMAGFCAARTMSTRNEHPDKASRPFDLERDGFVMGEGSGMLVLETLAHAQARGATILAELTGYGATGDAYHITAPEPSGEGIGQAMTLAMQDAGLTPADIQYLNAHGTSTPINDITETVAIKRIFGESAYKLAINSTKSMTGHLLGAAGGIEAIAVIMSLRDQKVHPTRNLENPDPQCDLDYVPGHSRDWPIQAALTNSMGFGGHNASLVFQRFS